jgi:HSP20 family protein
MLAAGRSLPAVNISETDGAYNIEVAAPGLDKKDFKVHVEHGCVVVEATKETRTASGPENGSDYRRQEFNYSSFRRSFALPDDVQEDKISSKYENGVLAVTLPRNEQGKSRPSKEITVK